MTEREPKAGSLAMVILDLEMVGCGVYTWHLFDAFTFLYTRFIKNKAKDIKHQNICVTQTNGSHWAVVRLDSTEEAWCFL